MIVLEAAIGRVSEQYYTASKNQKLSEQQHLHYIKSIKDLSAELTNINGLIEQINENDEEYQAMLAEQKRKIEELRQAYLDYIDSFSGIVSEYESMQKAVDTTAKAQELFSQYGIEGIGKLSTKLEEANAKQLEVGKTLSDIIKKQKEGNELSSDELSLLEEQKAA